MAGKVVPEPYADISTAQNHPVRAVSGYNTKFNLTVVVMAKTKLSYSCRACGALTPKWSGQCADCGEWNTLEESLAAPAGNKKVPRFEGYAGKSVVTSIENVSLEEEPRISSGLSELDRALGGGLVPGSVTLIGGDPGIGKSTLLLQCLAAISSEYPTLYVTGEESLQQVTLRVAQCHLLQ